MSLDLSLAALTDVGQARQRNEDAFAVSPDLGLVIVADGMGGCPAGDVASQMAVEALMGHFTELEDGGGDNRDQASEEAVRRSMENGVKRANARILRYAKENSERQGMGTTLTALRVHAQSGRWVIGHVGDSRVYRCFEGELAQVTRDHTWVQAQVEKGSLSAEAARLHPFGHILSQALGVDPELNIEIRSGSAESGETYLLCSDGLTAVLSDEDLLSVLAHGEHEEPEAIARTLVERANEGGGPDNITVGVLQVR